MLRNKDNLIAMVLIGMKDIFCYTFNHFVKKFHHDRKFYLFNNIYLIAILPIFVVITVKQNIFIKIRKNKYVDEINTNISRVYHQHMTRQFPRLLILNVFYMP